MNYCNIKNVLFWGTLKKKKLGRKGNIISDQPNWRRFWVIFSSEKTGISFCEALLSNITRPCSARCFNVYIGPCAGLTLDSNQSPTQPLTHSSSSHANRTGGENKKEKNEKTLGSRWRQLNRCKKVNKQTNKNKQAKQRKFLTTSGSQTYALPVSKL